MKNQKSHQTIEILNFVWNVKDLKKIANENHIMQLIKEYKKDQNCYPTLWINDENLNQIEKASFIYAVLNFSY